MPPNSGSRQSGPRMHDLTLNYAQRIVSQGRAAAKTAGLNAVFAILDRGAHLVTFARMDGDGWRRMNWPSPRRAPRSCFRRRARH
nr:heme-binding protein [Janthinobacterium sp. K2Li3]